MKKGGIVILDFGSQYNQLIARRVREMGVYAEVVPFHEDVDKILAREPKGIILSGGPASVYAEGAPSLDIKLFEQNIPILGLCYGMQLITHLHGGKVARADKQEFGKAELELDDKDNCLYKNIPNKTTVWMSHGDHVTEMAPNFKIIAHTDSSIAAIENKDKNIYAFQYHPEVTHSQHGFDMLKNFVFEIAKAEQNWSMENYIESTVKSIKETVGNKQVILGLSGGVDSSVAAALINKAIGRQLTCIFVDTGLLRKDEAKQVMEVYAKNFDMNIKCVNAEERFLSKLAGVTDPETKRKIIGKEFVEVFNEEAKKIEDRTLYNTVDAGGYTIKDENSPKNSTTRYALQYDLAAVLQMDDLEKNGARTYIYSANGDGGIEALKDFDNAISTYKPNISDQSAQSVITGEMRDLLAGKGGLENQNIVNVLNSIDTLEKSKDGNENIFGLKGHKFSKQNYITNRQKYFRELLGESDE